MESRLFDSKIETLVVQDRYYICLEATERAETFLRALGAPCQYVGTDQDSGRARFQFEYDGAFDSFALDARNLIGDLRSRCIELNQQRLLASEQMPLFQDLHTVENGVNPLLGER